MGIFHEVYEPKRSKFVPMNYHALFICINVCPYQCEKNCTLNNHLATLQLLSCQNCYNLLTSRTLSSIKDVWSVWLRWDWNFKYSILFRKLFTRLV